MAKSVQASVFGATGHTDVATIDTHARILRPLLQLPRAICPEIKVHVGDDGLRSKFVDSANVALGQFYASPAAFDYYDIESETVIGVNVDCLASVANRARMRKNDPDPVNLDVDQRRMLVTTEREYVDTTVRQTDDFQLIDPDSLRDEPEEPDIAHEWRAEVDTHALDDAVQHLDDVSKHARLFEEDGTMVLGGVGDGGDFDSVADFGHVTEEVDEDATTGAEVLLSLEYLTDITSALRKAKIETVSIRWKEEYPMRMDFERTIETGDGEEVVAYGGHYTVAPRIQSEE